MDRNRDSICHQRDATSSVKVELETIRVAAERAAALTRQLLAFARKQVLALKALNLNDIVSRLESVLRRVLGENIVLSIELAPELWTVSADAVLLEQVLLNLLANARDALAGRGGEAVVTLRDGSVRVELPVRQFVPWLPESVRIAEGTAGDTAGDTP